MNDRPEKLSECGLLSPMKDVHCGISPLITSKLAGVLLSIFSAMVVRFCSHSRLKIL